MLMFVHKAKLWERKIVLNFRQFFKMDHTRPLFVYFRYFRMTN